MNFASETIQLRKMIPVGIKHAEKLLTITNGDVEQAKQLHANQMTELFMQKQGASREQAVKHLEAAGYDISIAIRNYENEIYTTTELCLLKNKNKHNVLSAVLYAIEEKYNTTFWLCWEKEHMPQLTQAEYTFVVLTQWRNYEGWEGFLCVSPIIATELRKINAEWLSMLYEPVVKRLDELKDTDKYISDEKVYQELYDVYLKREGKLINALYEFIEKHIKDFP